MILWDRLNIGKQKQTFDLFLDNFCLFIRIKLCNSNFVFLQQAAAGQGYDQSQHQQYAAAQQQHQVDNAVLQQQQHNFDVQVRYSVY